MFARRALYRRNLILALLLEALWSWAIWLSHPFTIIPVFLMRLGASTTAIGFLAALRALGSGMIVLMMGSLTAHRRYLARIFGIWHFVAVLPYVGLSLLAFLAGTGAMGNWNPAALALLFAVSSSALLGGQTPVYFVLLSRLTSESNRTRFFGIVFSIGPIVGILGPVIAAVMLKGPDGEMLGYARIFGISSVLAAAGTAACFFLRERRMKPMSPRTIRDQLDVLASSWRNFPALRRYMKARMWLAGTMLAIAYLATYARHEARMPEQTIVLLAYFMLLTQGVGSYLLGWAGSRRSVGPGLPGRRALFIQWLNMAFIVSALFFAAFAPARWAAPVLAMAAGLIIAGDMALQPNILMNLGPSHIRKDIVSLAALVFMPLALLIPPISGLFIESLGHRPVFAAAAVVGLYGLRELNAVVRGGDGQGPSKSA